MAKDKYDKAVEYLTANPNLIVGAWFAPDDDTAQKLRRHTACFNTHRSRDIALAATVDA